MIRAMHDSVQNDFSERTEFARSSSIFRYGFDAVSDLGTGIGYRLDLLVSRRRASLMFLAWQGNASTRQTRKLTRDNSSVQTLLAHTFTLIVSLLAVLCAGTSTSTPSHQHLRYHQLTGSIFGPGTTYSWFTPEEQQLLGSVHLCNVDPGSRGLIR